MMMSRLYLRARREVTNYPLTSTMSRENWCFGCFQLARYVLGTEHHERVCSGRDEAAISGSDFGSIENPCMYRRLD
jgi:hypothetical protein